MRFAFGPFEIDPARKDLFFKGQALNLHSQAAFDALLLLVQNSGQLMSKEDFIQAIWPGTAVDDVNLNVAIHVLRQELDPKLREQLGTERSCIRTEPRRGFRFVLPVKELSDQVEIERTNQAPYEFRALDNYLTLDITDRTGAKVLFTKKSRIRILRNNAYHYVEDMSADGAQSDFEVSPGIVESVHQEEGKTLIKTTFGQPRSKGEEFSRTFKCVFRNSFCGDREYWVQRQVYPTDEFCVTIVFPVDRPFRDYHSVLKQGTYTQPCQQPGERRLNGRPALVWKIPRPRFKESYKIEWAW
jgi:DNA-binding winged helix-turn-helix (wHTH) protein